MVAPAYIDDSYVDHELSANLDSTYAFEGPEKLLEIWFWKSDKDIPQTFNQEGLRCIALEKWVKILDLVNCKVLSMKSSKFMDAYLLSESSFFVFPHKLILKTCGTTTTLAALNEIFELVSGHFYDPKIEFNGKHVHKVFYSRRSFMFPEKQVHVHKDWKNEVSLLNNHFINGKSYVVGNFTSDDHWYLYTGGELEPHCEKSDHDQTFEILMTQLDPEKAQQFVTSRKPGVESLIKSGVEEHDLGHDVGMDTMRESGLADIFEGNDKIDWKSHLPSPSPDNSETEDESMNSNKYVKKLLQFDFIHDAFSFAPCGYSSNSIESNLGGYYYTLHITPETGWSYASFETNYPFSDKSPASIVDVLLKVLKIFEPRKFSMTLINEMIDQHCGNITSLQNCDVVLRDYNYKKQEKIVYDLSNNYKLLYLNFEKMK